MSWMVLDESLKALWCHLLSLFQLYNEVRSRREPGDVGTDAPNEARGSTRFSLQSASTGSSVLTDPSDVHSSSYSDSTHRHSHRPGGGGDGGDLSGRLSNSHNSSSSSGSGSNRRGDGASRSGTRSEAKVDRRAPTCAERQEIDMGIDTAELEGILQGCLGQKLDRHPSQAGQEGLLNPFSDLQNMDIRCGTDKRNTIALNAVRPRLDQQFFSSRTVLQIRGVLCILSTSPTTFIFVSIHFLLFSFCQRVQVPQ